jgi:hypothetical protein
MIQRMIFLQLSTCAHYRSLGWVVRVDRGLCGRKKYQHGRTECTKPTITFRVDLLERCLTSASALACHSNLGLLDVVRALLLAWVASPLRAAKVLQAMSDTVTQQRTRRRDGNR